MMVKDAGDGLKWTIVKNDMTHLTQLLGLNVDPVFGQTSL